MNATITIEMDNAAFTENPGFELARILHNLAENVGDWLYNTSVFLDGFVFPIYDRNGNKVGKIAIE